MAIDTTVTLKRLIAEFSEWATAHPMVNDFGYGQYLETYRSSENKYAGVIVNSPSATSEDFFINYSWEVICLDYVLDQNDNRDRVNSDTQDILRDLENTIRYSKRWKNFSRAEGNWTYRKVDEFGADKCFGWIATFTIKIKKKHGICDIQSLMPTYDFEMGAVVYPSCDPVTFAINGTDEDSFASGAEFDLTLVDTDGNVPVYSYNNVLKKLTVPAEITCDPVAVTFNTVPVTSTPSGGTKAVIVQSTDPVQIGTAIVDDAGNLTIEVGQATIKNKSTDPTWTDTVSPEGNYILAEQSYTDSDGTSLTQTYDPAVPIVCTPNVVPVNSGEIFKTGCVVSNNTGDDGDIKRGAGDDFFNMEDNNPFGHPKAYTGTTGGYYDEVAGNYKDVNGNVTTEALAFPDKLMLNWKAWSQAKNIVFCMDYTPIQTGTVASMIAAAPYTRGGFTGFYVLNMGEYERFFHYGLPGFNYPPFSFIIGGGGIPTRVYSSTRASAGNYFGYVSLVQSNQLIDSALSTVFLGKYLNLTTDLGL